MTRGRSHEPIKPSVTFYYINITHVSHFEEFFIEIIHFLTYLEQTGKNDDVFTKYWNWSSALLVQYYYCLALALYSLQYISQDAQMHCT